MATVAEACEAEAQKSESDGFGDDPQRDVVHEEAGEREPDSLKSPSNFGRCKPPSANADSSIGSTPDPRLASTPPEQSR
jgi:hypothetical protein